MTHQTRREFLTVPAAVGSAAILSAQSPSDSMRVAFIGVGNRGSYLLNPVKAGLCGSVPDWPWSSAGKNAA